jgi:class 3 adenylate cyclase
MSRQRLPSSRRLATVLFLDIVDSTKIAAELGDARWRGMLGRFRKIVRAELKRYRGHEEDTAGDGFFATFAQPRDGLRAAVAIIGAVQEIGLEVRCGLHFGECETIEGRLGGIAVHIGSRIMSLGGAAQVLITGTVRDLVTGAEADVEDAGTHELKGVPGTWQVWRVTKLEGEPLPAPADVGKAHELRANQRQLTKRTRRRLVALGAVTLALVALIAVAGIVTGNLFAAPPVNLLKIDADTNAIVTRLSDNYRDEHLPNALLLVNGVLWQGTNKGFEGFVRRDIRTGEVVQKFELHAEPSAAAIGFGSIWLSGLQGPGSIQQWDPVSGRVLHTLSVSGTIVSMDAGADALWVLGDEGTLFEVNPVTRTLVKTYDSQTDKPGVVVALSDKIWVCDCEEHRIVEFDPASDKVVRKLTFPQSGVLVGLSDTAGSTTLWLLDFQAATLTPIDGATGSAGQPIGIGTNLHGATVAFGAVWVVAGDKVLRIDGRGPEISKKISMPAGFSAGSIVADPETHSLWVADCGCPLE